MIWQLMFYKTADASHADGFDVGYFDSLDEVEAVKAAYMASLPGFRDNPEGTWELIGHAVNAPADGIVWRICGYNWSEDGDERDLLYSPVFADRAAAEACLAALKACCQRERLDINRIQVNQRWWAEGFSED